MNGNLASLHKPCIVIISCTSFVHSYVKEKKTGEMSEGNEKLRTDFYKNPTVKKNQ